jgi:hypothetical protein
VFRITKKLTYFFMVLQLNFVVLFKDLFFVASVREVLFTLVHL